MGLVSWYIRSMCLNFTLYISFAIWHTFLRSFTAVLHLHVSAYGKGVGVKWLGRFISRRKTGITRELSSGTSRHSFCHSGDLQAASSHSRKALRCRARQLRDAGGAG